MLLKSKYKQILLDIFSGLSIDAEVWVYGSRVNGDAHDGSDLDLVILTHDHEKVPIDTLLDLKEKIQKSNIPIIIELFDWARLPESFHKNIEVSHEILFSSKLNILQEPKAGYNKKEQKE